MTLDVDGAHLDDLDAQKDRGLLDEAVAVSSNFIAHGEIVSVRARHPQDRA